MPRGKSMKLAGSTGRKKKMDLGRKGGASVAPAAGRRKGTKRSDLRYVAPDGSEWASPFEHRVFAALQAGGVSVRRTTPADALAYTTPVKNGKCESCGGCKVVQLRRYTPDLAVEKPDTISAADNDRLIYLETKGYFPASKRNLFRAARQSNPQVDVRLVVSSNHWVTKGKTRLTDWAKRFKIPIHVWDGALPEDWL